jgi:hypothetical protein
MFENSTVCDHQSTPILCIFISFYLIISFLPLGAPTQGEFWPPEQSASILLCSEAV